MTATPVGYDVFQSKRRKGLTLLSFILASTLFTSLTIYVDSYSIHQWEKEMDVGPIAMMAIGPNIISQTDNVQEINGITKVIDINYAYIEFVPLDSNNNMFCETWEFSADFFSEFSNTVELINGSLPTASNQIAFHSQYAQDRSITIGQMLNYTMDYEEFSIVTVVGIIDFINPSSEHAPSYFPTQAIISEGIIEPIRRDEKLVIEIDRRPLTPFNTGGSMGYLEDINNAIMRLDPFYEPEFGYSNYYVDNYLSQALFSFIQWQTLQRIAQLSRSAGIGLLVAFVIFLAIRNNINERRYESSMLIARGASEEKIQSIENRELALISLVSIPLGLLFGVLFSRVGIASIDFLVFDFAKVFTEPLMVTSESLVISGVSGLLLPIFVLVSYRMVYSTKKRVDESEGKLAKLSRILTYIRWDSIVLIGSFIALFMAFSAGNLIYSFPFLIPILVILPAVLFAALASLCTKALRRGSTILAASTSKITGFLPSAIGVRRLGKEASSAGPAMMVLVLSISLVWTSATLHSSIPTTKIGQTRFGIGADVSFYISQDYDSELDEFLTNITSYEGTEAAAIVRNVPLGLSATYSEGARITAINPLEYRNVGFDASGNPLNETTLDDSLRLLADTPSGAIITADIANIYELSVGDSFRAFQNSMSETNIVTFIVVDITDALPDTNLFRRIRIHYEHPSVNIIDSGFRVGKRAIWVNWNYINSTLNISTSDIRVCVRTKDNVNGTKLVEKLLEQGAGPIFQYNLWQSVSNVMDTYQSNSQYHIDRSVDSMLLGIEILVVFGSFLLYAAEGIRNRKREIALLHSLGADRNLIVKAQSAEMFVISFLSIIFLIIYTPVLIINNMSTHISSYEDYQFMFPITMILSVPWFLLLSILLFFIAAIAIFVIGIAFTTSKVNLAETLNASWTEAGPYGGDV
ncbi:MAG: FtsX-like permease family protein [Candidatus Lokiarchaeota archaeon]|nr:FtsX-like permease family protein [Candidatus Lokiarchaeota archaeon]